MSINYAFHQRDGYAARSAVPQRAEGRSRVPSALPFEERRQISLSEDENLAAAR